MAITPLRLVLFTAFMALVAVVATLATIAGVMVYNAQRAVPTVDTYRAPAYIAPPPHSVPSLGGGGNSAPIVWPTSVPFVLPTSVPSQFQQQDDMCRNLGFGGASLTGPGCWGP